MKVILSDKTEYQYNKKEFVSFIQKYYANGYTKKQINGLINNNKIEEYYFICFFEMQGRDLLLETKEDFFPISFRN